MSPDHLTLDPFGEAPVTCHFLVTNETTWVKAPSMELSTREALGKCPVGLLLGFEHYLAQIPTIVSEMLCVPGSRSKQTSRQLSGQKPRYLGGLHLGTP